MLQLFREYNKLIALEKKGIEFFDANPDLIDTKIEKYRNIVNDLAKLRIEICKNYQMSDDEIINGFRQIKFLEGCKNG